MPDDEGCPPELSRRSAKLEPAGYGRPATLTLQPKELITTTTVRSLPKWLRVRLQKPAPQKTRTISLKDRQVLPTLPNWARSAIAFQHNHSAGDRVLEQL